MHHMNIRISKLLLAIHKTKMENTVWFPYYCVNIKTFQNNLNVQINNLFTFRAFLSILAPIFSCLQLLLESGQWTWDSGVEYAILQWLVNGVYMLDCRSTHSAHLYQGCARLAWAAPSCYTANAYRQMTDKLMFKSVISTVRWIRK